MISGKVVNLLLFKSNQVNCVRFQILTDKVVKLLFSKSSIFVLYKN